MGTERPSPNPSASRPVAAAGQEDDAPRRLRLAPIRPNWIQFGQVAGAPDEPIRDGVGARWAA